MVVATIAKYGAVQARHVQRRAVDGGQIPLGSGKERRCPFIVVQAVTGACGAVRDVPARGRSAARRYQCLGAGQEVLDESVFPGLPRPSAARPASAIAAAHTARWPASSAAAQRCRMSSRTASRCGWISAARSSVERLCKPARRFRASAAHGVCASSARNRPHAAAAWPLTFSRSRIRALLNQATASELLSGDRGVRGFQSPGKIDGLGAALRVLSRCHRKVDPDLGYARSQMYGFLESQHRGGRRIKNQLRCCIRLEIVGTAFLPHRQLNAGCRDKDGSRRGRR